MKSKKPLKNFKDKFDSSAGEQLSTDCESLTKQFSKGRASDPFILPKNEPKPLSALNGNKICDISRKYKPKFSAEKNLALSRSIMYNLRFKAGDILGERTARCGCVAGWDERREIAIMQKEENFYISGVETCGSVWNCPVCALKISTKRAEQVREILTWSQTRETFSHGFLTLTTRHNKTEKCKDVKKRVLDAWRKVTQTRKYKEFGAETIRALEVKFNINNGWHPHLHIAIIAEKSQTELKQFVQSFIIPKFLNLMDNESMSANQKYKEIWGGNGVSDYITKWDLSLELTHAESKNNFSNSYTPFGMLKELVKQPIEFSELESTQYFYPAGQKTAQKTDEMLLRMELEKRFLEYSKAFKGSKQLTISRKLKDKFKEFDLLTDEEIVKESQEGSEIKLKISRELFKTIASNRVQADVINAFQIGGLALLQTQLLEFGISHEYDPDTNLIKEKEIFRGWGNLEPNYKFYPHRQPKQETFNLDFE
jgi:hypothetical protein